VPDKRRDSKQRRQTRNQAQRGSLAARREHAAAAAARPSSASSTSSARGSTAKTRGGGSTGAAAASGGKPAGRAGEIAVWLSLALAVAGALAVVLFVRIPVDDRGEPLPRQFGALTLMARETVTGSAVPDATKTLLEANGPGILAILALPIVVTGFAVWAYRRPDRARLLTFALIVMAGIVLLGLGLYFMPALIALFAAYYLVRREQMGPRPERAPRRGGAIDVSSKEAPEPEPEPQDAVVPEPQDAVVGDDDEPGNEDEDDAVAGRGNGVRGGRRLWGR
jgi:hypothetical protein